MAIVHAYFKILSAPPSAEPHDAKGDAHKEETTAARHASANLLVATRPGQRDTDLAGHPGLGPLIPTNLFHEKPPLFMSVVDHRRPLGIVLEVGRPTLRAAWGRVVSECSSAFTWRWNSFFAHWAPGAELPPPSFPH